MPLIISDIDSTIIKPLGQNIFPDPDNFTFDQQLINKDLFKNLNGKLVGLSSQAGIQQGYITEAMCISRFQHTMNLMPQLEAIIFVPDWIGSKAIICFKDYVLEIVADINENFRKPSPDAKFLIEEIFEDEAYLMIGDGEDDEAFAKNAKLDFIKV